MIKAAATRSDGRALLVFGLSRVNTVRLLEGKPIMVDTTKAMGMEGGPIVVIMGGETEEAIARELAAFLPTQAASAIRQPQPGETIIFTDPAKGKTE